MRTIRSLLGATLLLTACGTNQQEQMAFQNTIPIEPNDSKEMIIEKAAHVVPTENQLAALHNEYIAFIHFGPNTFTRREWGTGMEDPKIFDLKNLDTDQWCETMKAAGYSDSEASRWLCIVAKSLYDSWNYVESIPKWEGRCIERFICILSEIWTKVGYLSFSG